MRFKRLARRMAIAGILAALFMAGLFIGRMSIRYTWVEGFCTFLYIFNILVWFWPMHAEAKREDQEFKEFMRKFDEETWR